MTGIVVAGQPATITAVGPTGAVLAGTVIEVAGEERTTDEKGRVTFIVPAAIATVAAVLPGVLDSSPSFASVRPWMPMTTEPTITPAIDHAPPNPIPGSTVKISGRGFSGGTDGNIVEVGGNASEVLASSPAEIVAVIPADAEIGPQSIVVTTADGESNAYPVEVTQIWFEGADTQLSAGQTGKGYLRVSCDDPKTIALSNDNDVISLTAGDQQILRTSGGANNGVPVLYVANRPGMFSVRAEIIDSVAQDADDDDDSDVAESEEPARRWAQEAEKSALAAAEAAEKVGNKATIANAAAELGSFADDDRRWEDDGSEKYKEAMRKTLKSHIKKMETLSGQADRTEQDNPAVGNHLRSAAQALRNALNVFGGDGD